MRIKTLFYAVFLPVFLLLGLGFAMLLLLGVRFESSYYNEKACLAQLDSITRMICSSWQVGVQRGGISGRDRDWLNGALDRVRLHTDAHAIWILDGEHALIAQGTHEKEDVELAQDPAVFVGQEHLYRQPQRMQHDEHHVLRVGRALMVEQNGQMLRLGTLVLDYSIDEDVRRESELERYVLIAAAIIALLGILVISFISKKFERESRVLGLAADENMSVEEVSTSELSSKIREIDDLVKTIGILKDVRMDVRKRAARAELDRVRSL